MILNKNIGYNIYIYFKSINCAEKIKIAITLVQTSHQMSWETGKNHHSSITVCLLTLFTNDKPLHPSKHYE